MRGHAVGVPRAAALPLALQAARAMRPWKRPWPTGRRRTLDLSATVDAYARSGELIPVFTAGPERWFDLVLIVDGSLSMRVWQETIEAFTGVLAQLGAFRTLQVIELGCDAGSDSGIELRDRQGRPIPPGRLCAPHGRHLVLMVSDCASSLWREPDIWEHLRTWARTTPVALLNPLPTKLWRRTGLDLPTVRVAPGAPGAGNAELLFALPPLLPVSGEVGGEWLPLPVLSLSPHSLDRWSRAVMQAAPEGCAAVLIPPGGRAAAHSRPGPSRGAGDRARAERFLHTATPAAARLAVLCSPFDRLSLALVHVIRQELVPEATTADIAEVLTSGLFPLDGSPDGSVALAPSPAARARLQQELAQHDVWRLNRALSRRLPSQSNGRGSLPAVVGGPCGTHEFPAESRPFGHALERTLELLGLAAPTPDPPGDQDGEAATADHAQDFWMRYLRHLRIRTWREDELHRLDESTDGVLARLEDPRRAGPWRRSGLVIEPAGSGRTTHFIGLAAKAVDAGYRLIVVLAGTSNAVRSQTQMRVDEGLLGSGADALPGAEALPIASLTDSTEQGDFTLRTAAGMNLPLRSSPIVLVIKKNLRTVRALHTWVRQHADALDPATGHELVSETPLLVVDAVDSSRGNTVAPTRGNRSSVDAAVRDLVSAFEKAAYVRYASTPFATPRDPTDDGHGGAASPFPHDFLYNLPVPSNYLGPERLFGSPGDAPGSLESEAPPLVRLVWDQEPWMPVRHSATHVPDREPPGSLLSALDAFVLACAARRARGQATAHNSMLVSVSRFISIQDHVRRQLAERVRFMAATLRDGRSSASSSLLEELRRLWVEDFQPTTDAFPGGGFPMTSWAEVAPHVEPAVRKIRVMAVNSASRRAPAYHEHAQEGLSVVAIGGAKLTQEFTFEGLTVGYHLRTSSTHDALVRLAGWFGYRAGYEDLCRLYATSDLVDAYQELTSPARELPHKLHLFDTGEREPLPAAHYSGRTAETVAFDLSPDLLDGNLRVLEGFVRSLDAHGGGTVDPVNGSLMWRGVPVETVLTEFLDAYLPGPPPAWNRLAGITEYVRWGAARGELGNWTVQFIGRAAASHQIDVAGHLIGLVRRGPVGPVRPSGIYTVKRLLSPGDACKDLDADQLATALQITSSRAAARRSRLAGEDEAAGNRHQSRLPAAYALHEVRRADQPLLTIYPLLSPLLDGEGAGTPVVGYAASFPRTARGWAPLWPPQ
jgi:hypothetical protein